MPKHNPVQVVLPSAGPSVETNRLTPPVVLGVVAFPAIGATLAATGMPTAEIIPLLGYSTGIGVSAVLALSGGRRLVAALAAFAVRASQQ